MQENVPLNRPMTEAEKIRKKRLEDDPLAEIFGPLFVSCRVCGSRIKLSPKSTYDLFHWNKHRERCIKRAQGTTKRSVKATPKPKARRGKQTFSPEIQILYSKISSASSLKSDLPSVTPSLTTDDGDDCSSKGAMTARSISPLFEGPSFRPVGEGGITTPVHEPYFAFDEYMSRSRRHPENSNVSEPSTWQSWSWNQLKAPVYDASGSVYTDKDSDNGHQCDEMLDEMDMDMVPSWNQATVGTLDIVSSWLQPHT